MGPVNENEMWRIRYNDKIYNLYSEPNIVNIIKVGRLRWIGHIMRMQEDNATRRLLRPDEGRRRGRPKLRWMDGIEEDLRKLGALDGMVNGKKFRGRRIYQMIENIMINGLYEDTKRKVGRG